MGPGRRARSNPVGLSAWPPTWCGGATGIPAGTPGAATAVTDERVTLFGLPLVDRRTIDFGRVDPAGARDLFLEHALVEGDWRSRHQFRRRNAEAIEEVRRLEDRARRPLLVGPDALFAFYDARVGGSVTSGRGFDRWWDEVRPSDPHRLDLGLDDLMGPGAGLVRAADFPDEWHQGGLVLALSYVFDPGAPDDGVSVDVPLGVLEEVSPAGFDWQVPGMRGDLVTALIRSLPKAVRRHFTPAAEYAREFLARAGPGEGPLIPTLERTLPMLTGDPLPPGSWNVDGVPAHLRMGFRAVDEQGRAVAYGKDLAALRQLLSEEVRGAIVRATGAIELTGLRAWTFGTLPQVVAGTWAGLPVRGYPTLVDEGDSVGIRVVTTEAEQRHQMWAGTSRLLAVSLAAPTAELQRRLNNDARLALDRTTGGSVTALLDDCVTAAIDRLLAVHGGPVWDEAAFSALSRAVRADLRDTAVAVVTFAGAIVTAAARIEDRLERMGSGPALRPAVADVRAQLAGLVHRRFVAETGASRLPDVLRYLRAIARRLDKLPENPGRDRERMERVQQLASAYRAAASSPGPQASDVDAVRWMIEELRVSLWAQQLGTAHPVSEQRVRRAIDRLAG